MSRKLYKNVFIKKKTPLLSDMLKGACKTDFEKSAVVYGDLAVYKTMYRQLLVLQLHA